MLLCARHLASPSRTQRWQLMLGHVGSPATTLFNPLLHPPWHTQSSTTTMPRLLITAYSRHQPRSAPPPPPPPPPEPTPPMMDEEFNYTDDDAEEEEEEEEDEAPELLTTPEHAALLASFEMVHQQRLEAGQMAELEVMLFDEAAECSHQFAAREAAAQALIAAKVRAWQEIQAQRDARDAAREAKHRAMLERTHEGRLTYEAARQRRAAEETEAARRRREKGKGVIIDLSSDGEGANDGAGPSA